MLLEFRVRNFRSIRDECVLSFAASPDKSYSDTHVAPSPIKAIPGVLRAAAIYGANAAGKSNIIRALILMKGIVEDSATLLPNQAFNIQSFALDPDTTKAPIEFEITFLLNGTRIQYGFSLRPDRIHSEWLIAYETRKPQILFRREHIEGQPDKYTFSVHLTGSKSVWQKATRPNALFLSTAVQLNSERLTEIFNYLSNEIVIFQSGALPAPDFTANVIKTTGSSEAIRTFLVDADIAIADIEIDVRKTRMHDIKFDPAANKIETDISDHDMLVALFTHRSAQGQATFELGDESEGTQKLFMLAGPMLDILAKGRVLVIDELDRSLHPLLVQQLIEMFYNPELNIGNAQLLFTTHNTSLLDSVGLLRRDQVWLVEKTRDQATILVPLSDFQPRKNEAFERGYLGGRYGGIPLLRHRRL